MYLRVGQAKIENIIECSVPAVEVEKRHWHRGFSLNSLKNMLKSGITPKPPKRPTGSQSRKIMG